MSTFKYGLKLFSTNVEHAKEAKQLLKRGIFHYIELYAVPGSFTQTIKIWEEILPAMFIIHAPHSAHGVNLSKKSQREQNKQLLTDAILFANALSASNIIVHGGSEGSLEEVIYQIFTFCDPRFTLENTPKQGIHNQVAVAWSPAHMKKAIQTTVFCGIVLDIGHAIYAANSENLDWKEYLLEFIALQPQLYHLSDGILTSIPDIHKRFGDGDFDIPYILSLLPEKSKITLETPKNFERGLQDAEEDSRKIREILCCKK